MSPAAASPLAPAMDEVLVPLVVDLDGTLINSDLLLESFFALLAANPVHAVKAALRLRDGKAALKAALADAAVVDLHDLPFNPVVLDYLKAEKARGRRIYIASASDERHVTRLAEHLGLFDGAFGSDGVRNLAGRTKAARLVEEFGAKGFDYIGNDTVDLAVWDVCRRPMAANASPRLVQEMRRRYADMHDLGGRRPQVRDYMKALRLHQWMKNILVFVPLIAGHRFGLGDIATVVLAFLAFGLAASSAYQLNDLLDLAGDRDHPTKRFRPLACGAVPLLHGALLVPVLLLAAAVVALAASPAFLGVLALYYATTLLYSLYLKRRVLVDVMTLTGLYTLRILGGAAALEMAPSAWLLAFSVFIFLCLGIVKRYVELVGRLKAEKGNPKGRGYVTDDLPMLAALAGASGYSAVVVLALYLSSPDVHDLYTRPTLLWGVCPLVLYWVSRVLLIAHRGHLHDDPVLFAAKDRVSLMVGGLVLVLVALAI